MAYPRTPIAELELTGSKNLGRALKRHEEDANRPPLAKQAEMEDLFEDLKERRRDALTDVKENGIVITQEKSNARGAIYHIKVINPALKVVQDCERQLAAVARLLGVARPKGRGQSIEDLLRQADDLCAGAEN